MFFQCFLSSLDYILIITTILITPIILIKQKEPIRRCKTPPKDRLFLSQTMVFKFQKGKIALKRNKKRRIGTNNCILFCVLVWCPLRESSFASLNASFAPQNVAPYRALLGGLRCRGRHRQKKKAGLNVLLSFFGDPYGNRTHVFAVRGRCLSRLTKGPFFQLCYYIIFFLKLQYLFEKIFLFILFIHYSLFILYFFKKSLLSCAFCDIITVYIFVKEGTFLIWHLFTLCVKKTP